MYGDERIMVNSAGDWGPSNPTAVPDFIMELRRRGHSESKIKKIVYDNPIEFFSGSERFEFTPPDVFRENAPTGVDAG
jgi:predicted metal-dependent TIM-barrel fold hydrolase